MFISWWVWLDQHPKETEIKVRLRTLEAENDLQKCCGWEGANVPEAGLPPVCTKLQEAIINF